MLYVVLGNGFSGTTLISELMHHSGVKMIDGINDNYDGGGKYEHPEFQQVNRDILQLKDDKVYQLRLSDCPEQLTNQQKDTILRLVEKQKKLYENWGFKDPRTVVTYPLWSKLLPEHRVIAIYRNPAANWPRHRWHGLRKRYTNLWRAYVHIRQWYEYNEAILKIGSNKNINFILLNYEKLMRTDDELKRLSFFLGISVNDMRKKNMHRSSSEGDFLFRSVKWFMQFGSYSPDKMLKYLEETQMKQYDFYWSGKNRKC